MRRTPYGLNQSGTDGPRSPSLCARLRPTCRHPSCRKRDRCRRPLDTERVADAWPDVNRCLPSAGGDLNGYRSTIGERYYPRKCLQPNQRYQLSRLPVSVSNTCTCPGSVVTKTVSPFW